MPADWRSVKPGWYLIVALVVYAAFATTQWRVAASALRDARVEAAAGPASTRAEVPSGASMEAGVEGGIRALPHADAAGATGGADTAAAATSAAATSAPTVRADAGLWYPIPGARVPADDAHLPGAERAYRSGVSQGFSFWNDSAGVPITYGTPVIAAGTGTVVRADLHHVELSQAEWDDLVARVADGADERQLDQLRGRQVWIELDDGRTLRYGHLSSVLPGLTPGTRVSRGQVIGAVGNSGTGDAVAGRTSNARLHFEVWQAGSFLGQDLTPDEVRHAAATVFTGP